MYSNYKKWAQGTMSIDTFENLMKETIPICTFKRREKGRNNGECELKEKTHQEDAVVNMQIKTNQGRARGVRERLF